jgi:hypothetical protein
VYISYFLLYGEYVAICYIFHNSGSINIDSDMGSRQSCTMTQEKYRDLYNIKVIEITACYNTAVLKHANILRMPSSGM